MSSQLATDTAEEVPPEQAPKPKPHTGYLEEEAAATTAATAAADAVANAPSSSSSTENDDSPATDTPTAASASASISITTNEKTNPPTPDLIPSAAAPPEATSVALPPAGSTPPTVSPTPTTLSPSPSPSTDGGWKTPWKVVLGAFCLTVPTFGLLSSVGLFQTYWAAHQLPTERYSESETSWIISVFGFLVCFCAAPCGLLFDRHGAGGLLGVGTVAYVGGFVGLAFAGGYGGFVGCLGVAGVAGAAPTTIAFCVVSQWFRGRKHEGLANGCVSLGAAIGGIVFSLVLQTLFDKLSWEWAILALSGIILGFLALGNALVETRRDGSSLLHEGGSGQYQGRELSSSNGTGGSRKWDWVVVSDMLKSSRFWLVVYAIFAYELVLFVQWGSIPAYAVHTDFGDKQFYLVMSYNIGAIIGRTLPPWISDRFLGPLNTIITMNMFTLLVVLVVWLPFGASTIPALFAAVVLMGIGTGSFVPLGVSCVTALCEPKDTGTWLGSVYTVVSFATLIGNPATGAILDRYGSTGLLVFLSLVLLTGLISAVGLRWLCQGRRVVVFGEKI